MNNARGIISLTFVVMALLALQIPFAVASGSGGGGCQHPYNIMVACGQSSFGPHSFSYGQSTTMNVAITNYDVSSPTNTINMGPYTATLVWCRLPNGQGTPPACVVPLSGTSEPMASGWSGTWNSVSVNLGSDPWSGQGGATGNFLSFTVNAYSYNTLQITFNGVTYSTSGSSYISTNLIGATNSFDSNNAVTQNVIFAGWEFNAIVQDSTGNTMSFVTPGTGTCGSMPCMNILIPAFLGIMPGTPTLQYLSPSGFLAFITSYSDSTLSLVNVFPSNIISGTGQIYSVQATIPIGTGPESLVSPPGEMMATAPTIVGTVNLGSNSISVINTAIKEVMQNLSLSGKGPVAVAVAPNTLNSQNGGAMAFADSLTNQVTIIIPPNSITSSFQQFSINLPANIVSPVAMDTYFGNSGSGSQLNTTLYVAGSTGNVIGINLNTFNDVFGNGNVINLGSKSQPKSIVACPCGYVYISEYGANQIGVINASSSHPGIAANITQGNGPGGPFSFNGPYAMAFDAASPRLYVTNYNTNTISIVNPFQFQIEGQHIESSSSNAKPDYVTTSPDGSLMYVANYGANDVSVLRIPPYNSGNGQFTMNGVIPANEPTSVGIFSNYFYNGSIPSNVMFSITTPGNQVSASLQWQNGNSLEYVNTNGVITPGSGSNSVVTNSIQFQIPSSSTGGFSFQFSTMGNANYTPMVMSKMFNIMPSFPYINMTLHLNNGTNVILTNQGQSFSLSGYSSALFPMTLTTNIITFGNQLPANVFVNGQSENTITGGTNTIVISSPADYSLVFNALSNGNYMAVDPSIAITLLTPPSSPSSGGSGGSGGVVQTTVTTVPITTVVTTIAAATTKSVVNTSSSNVSVNVSRGANQTVNFTKYGVKLLIKSNFTTPEHIAVYVTPYTANELTLPPGYSVVNAYNVSAPNTIVTVTLHYNCTINPSNIAPYIYNTKGTWSAITPFTVNSTACTESFTVPGDPFVALLQAPATTTTTTSSTTVQTTVSTTAAATTTIPSAIPKSNSTLLVVAIIIVIIIIVVAYYLLKGSKKRRRLGS